VNFARLCVALALAAAAAACGAPGPTTLPSGPAAYEVVPVASALPAAPTAYALRAGDTIAVEVFREPDLSADKLVVDEAGNIALPLLGEVPALGQSTASLAGAIQSRLARRYVRDPRVTVQLLATLAQTVSVEGEVNAPGVYPVARGETLLTTMARAKSPTKEAKRDEVVVFRSVNGQRMGAVFDLDAIRAGRAADPQILDGDVVVVGFSRIKGAYRDFLGATPLLYLFTVF